MTARQRVRDRERGERERERERGRERERERYVTTGDDSMCGAAQASSMLAGRSADLAGSEDQQVRRMAGTTRRDIARYRLSAVNRRDCGTVLGLLADPV